MRKDGQVVQEIFRNLFLFISIFYSLFDGTRDKFWFSFSVGFVRFEIQPRKH